MAKLLTTSTTIPPEEWDAADVSAVLRQLMGVDPEVLDAAALAYGEAAMEEEDYTAQCWGRTMTSAAFALAEARRLVQLMAEGR